MNPEQNYYTPQIQTNNPNNIMLSSNQPYNSQPQVITQNNPPSTNEGINNQIIPAIKNQDIISKPFSEIPHIGIFQPKENVFHIKTGSCIKCYPFFFLISSFPIMFFFVLPFLVDKISGENVLEAFGFGFGGIVLFLVGIMSLYRMYYEFIFVIGPNTLTLTKKALCAKETTIFYPGDLRYIEFNQHSYRHRYEIILFKKKDSNSLSDIQFLFQTKNICVYFTSEEIIYFVYTINNHIKINMKT